MLDTVKQMIVSEILCLVNLGFKLMISVISV